MNIYRCVLAVYSTVFVLGIQCAVLCSALHCTAECVQEKVCDQTRSDAPHSHQHLRLAEGEVSISIKVNFLVEIFTVMHKCPVYSRNVQYIVEMSSALQK